MGPRYAVLTSTIPVEPFSPPFHLAFHGFFLKSLPLIEEFLPFCKSEIDLHLSIDEVKLHRDQRISPLFHLADETFDLLLVKEKFPCPQWIMIQPVRLGISADVRIDEVNFAPLDITVTIPEVNFPLPQGFDLRPQQRNPGLVSLLDRVIMECLSILANQFFTHLSKPRIEHSAKRIAKIKQIVRLIGKLPSWYRISEVHLINLGETFGQNLVLVLPLVRHSCESRNPVFSLGSGLRLSPE